MKWEKVGHRPIALFGQWTPQFQRSRIVVSLSRGETVFKGTCKHDVAARIEAQHEHYEHQPSKDAFVHELTFSQSYIAEFISVDFCRHPRNSA